MSMGYRGKTTNWVRETVAVQASAEQESKMGEIPGEILSFDPATQTATIQPLYRPRVNNEYVSMPILQEVPVRFPRSGGAAVTMPVNAGDKVTLRPQMRSTSSYHTRGVHEHKDAGYNFLSSNQVTPAVKSRNHSL